MEHQKTLDLYTLLPPSSESLSFGPFACNLLCYMFSTLFLIQLELTYGKSGPLIFALIPTLDLREFHTASCDQSAHITELLEFCPLCLLKVFFFCIGIKHFTLMVTCSNA